VIISVQIAVEIDRGWIQELDFFFIKEIGLVVSKSGTEEELYVSREADTCEKG